jgi:hypothetical protein
LTFYSAYANLDIYQTLMLVAYGDTVIKHKTEGSNQMGFRRWVHTIAEFFKAEESKNTLETSKSKLDERKQPKEPRAPKIAQKTPAPVAEPTPEAKRVVSAETRAKLSAASKATHARKKAEEAKAIKEAAKAPEVKKVTVKSSDKTQKVVVKTPAKTTTKKK